MLIKQKSIFLQKLGSRAFWRLAILNKFKSAIPPLLNGLEVLAFASNKAKLCIKILPENLNLDDTGIFLPVSPSRINLKLRNIPVTHNTGKKVTTDLDFSKESGPN